MRTKRILSILLAMLMALGVFGVMGASAEEPVDEEEAVVVLAAEEEPEAEEEVAAVLAAAPAGGETEAKAIQKGWSAELAKGKLDSLRENFDHTKGSGTAEIYWEPFAANNDVDPKEKSFYDLYIANPKLATFEFEFQRKIDNEWKSFPVAANAAAALASTGAYVSSIGETKVILTIGQASAIKWYGVVQARIGVTHNGTTLWSDWKEALLSDASSLAEKINEAKKEYDKSDRYTDKYRDNLKAIIDLATLMLSTKLTAEEVEIYKAALDNAINGKDALGQSVGNRWKLTDKNGDNWIDNFLGQTVIAFIHQTKDVFATIQKVTGPLFSFFGQIGDFFGNFMPIFGLFKTLLGL